MITTTKEFNNYFEETISIDNEILIEDVTKRCTYYKGKIVNTIHPDKRSPNGHISVTTPFHKLGDVITINEDNFT